MKNPFQSKTIWFAILLAVLSTLQGFVSYLPTDPKYQALIGVIIAAVMTILRFMTTDPIMDTKNDDQ